MTLVFVVPSCVHSCEEVLTARVFHHLHKESSSLLMDLKVETWHEGIIRVGPGAELCLVNFLALGHEGMQRGYLECLHHRLGTLNERTFLKSRDLGLDAHHLSEVLGQDFAISGQSWALEVLGDHNLEGSFCCISRILVGESQSVPGVRPDIAGRECLVWDAFFSVTVVGAVRVAFRRSFGICAILALKLGADIWMTIRFRFGNLCQAEIELFSASVDPDNLDVNSWTSLFWLFRSCEGEVELQLFLLVQEKVVEDEDQLTKILARWAEQAKVVQ